jgi:hypothetical protein
MHLDSMQQPHHRSQCLGSFFSLGGQNPMKCGVLVPGFDEMVHRFGAKAVMSRRPFLPIALRVPLLAGVAIAMRDPAQTISRLRTRTRSHGNQRFTEIEADLGAGSANPVSH